jgi:hypothetical protein
VSAAARSEAAVTGADAVPKAWMLVAAVAGRTALQPAQVPPKYRQIQRQTALSSATMVAPIVCVASSAMSCSVRASAVSD